jgi:DNA repair protein RecN (Recombination protein N)
VIRSLEIRDLVVIERAQLEPAPGLTVITGETGAGKTVLAQALELLAGGAADARAVRPGARQALVQATVALPEGFWDRLEEDDPAAGLRELCEDQGEIVIARRIPAEGRARCLLDGHAVPREALASLAGALLRFSGQHQHRRLVGPAAQRAALDAFCGPEAVAAAERLAGLRRRLRAAERALAGARARREESERRRDELEALVRDVEAAALDPGEERDLLAERERLRHAERLALAAAAAAAALAPDGAEGGALDLVGAAVRALAPLVDVDPALEGPRAELAAAEASLQEASLALHGYLASLEVEPGRLERVEERLEAYERLRRRYGGTVEDVLRRAEEARAALAELDADAAGEDALAAERDALLAEARREGEALHARRAAAAPRLEERLAAELAELGLPAASVRVEVAVEPGDDPPRDRVTLWLRANPGLPEAPLAEAASGGELSRVLLALHGVAAAADGEAAWVFDEVDAGIGGVTAAVVGAKLAALARGRQVLAITHLPQVAALGDRHYRLVKGLDAAGRATTRIEPVEGDALVAELCRMLGATPEDAGARRHAEELVARAPRAARSRSSRARAARRR